MVVTPNRNLLHGGRWLRADVAIDLPKADADALKRLGYLKAGGAVVEVKPAATVKKPAAKKKAATVFDPSAGLGPIPDAED